MAPAGGGDEMGGPPRSTVVPVSAGAAQNLEAETGSRKRKAAGNPRMQELVAASEDSHRISVEIENLRFHLDEDLKELGYCEENEKLRVEMDHKDKEMQCLRKQNEELQAKYEKQHEELQAKYQNQDKELQAKYEKQNKELQTKYEEQYKELQAKYKNHNQELEAKYVKKNEELQSKYEKEWQAKHDGLHKDCKSKIVQILDNQTDAKRKQLWLLDCLCTTMEFTLAQLEGNRIPEKGFDEDSSSMLVSESLAEKSCINGNVADEKSKQLEMEVAVLDRKIQIKMKKLGEMLDCEKFSKKLCSIKAGKPTQPNMASEDIQKGLRKDDGPQYPLLEMAWDNQHRAHLAVDEGQVLTPLRPRTHSPLPWDERYAVYIRRAGFLPLARVVNEGLPNMDAAALTALVDRWRPETHTFHLPCGEVTVTLQDVAMILGLPVNGHAVCGALQPQGWRDMVQGLLGIRPPEPGDDEKDKRPTGVSSAWLSSNFGTCPEGADDSIVERYARAWLWHLVGGYLFPDGSGNTITWMVLPILGQQWEHIATYSWASATLAWLYRQLCAACTRTGQNANLGGCAYLLQVWMWERFPIGRPDRGPVEVWKFQDEGSLPTVAFLWKNIVNVVGNARRRYLSYTNELDVITQSQVCWNPYCRDEIEEMELSPLCRRDATYWRCSVPLIFFYVVEWHLPQRVMRQFGRLQPANVQTVSTSRTLHAIERRKYKGAVNWLETHNTYLALWNNRHASTIEPKDGPDHRPGPYKEYLRWLHANSRVSVKPPTNSAQIEDLHDSDEEVEIVDDYDKAQQLGRLANEASVILQHPPGSTQEYGALHAFIERVCRSCRHIAFKCNCITALDAVVAEPSAFGLQAASDSVARAPVHGTVSHTSSAAHTRTGSISSSPAASTAQGRGKGELPQCSESKRDNELLTDGKDLTYGQDVIGTSQLSDAPHATQDYPIRHHKRPRDKSAVGSANLLRTPSRRAHKKKQPYTPSP